MRRRLSLGHASQAQAPVGPLLGALGEPNAAAVLFKATGQSGELVGTAIQAAVIRARLLAEATTHVAAALAELLADVRRASTSRAG
jgi:hypothetical protein